MFQILIVEDDKELSQLFQKVLEKNGYQVKSASDGAQALEVLDKEYIDLIISDIMMPVMDGYELVSELRSAGYQIPVLMITAKGSFDDMDMRSAYLDTELMLVIRSKDINKQLEEGMMEYERVSRQVLEDGTYRDPYHVEPIELTKKRQRKIFLVQHLLGWARYLF